MEVEQFGYTLQYGLPNIPPQLPPGSGKTAFNNLNDGRPQKPAYPRHKAVRLHANVGQTGEVAACFSTDNKGGISSQIISGYTF
jgi:hypothetical protein